MAASDPISLSDLTVIIGARLGEQNPWIADRLALFRRHYRALPDVLVVDQGSARPYASRLSELCAAQGFAYIHDDDDGPYSPARAKNLGARAAATKLLFFCDLDFFGSPELFERLVHAANFLEFDRYLDRFLTLPIYHLAAEATASVLQSPSSGLALDRVMRRGVYAGFGGDIEFATGYSNCLLCRRDFYELVGGQNERFRRHGAEDFEFLLRVAVFIGRYPLPEDVGSHAQGPSDSKYFGPKAYQGYRRLFELMGIEAEVLGLRVAHLFHPRPKPGDNWFRERVDKREAFGAEVAAYLRSSSALAEYDFMPRERVAEVAIDSAVKADLACFLRLAGYRVEPTSAAGGADREPWHIGLPAVANAGESPEIAALLSSKSSSRTLELRGTALPRSAQHPAGRFIVTAMGDRAYRRVALDEPVSARSYAAARLGMALPDGRARKSSQLEQRLWKFVKRPRAFMADSRFETFRRIERLLR